jgi:hypothetical protein
VLVERARTTIFGVANGESLNIVVRRVRERIAALIVLGLLVRPGGVSILHLAKEGNRRKPFGPSSSSEGGSAIWITRVLWVVVGAVGVLLLVFLFRGTGRRRGLRGRGGLRRRWTFRR